MIAGMSTSRNTAPNGGQAASWTAVEQTVTRDRATSPGETIRGDATRGDATYGSATPPTGREDLTIDCECCALKETSACEDCVVTFLLEREPDDAVVIDADEARAMRMLERAGLLPSLRYTSSG